MKPFQPYADYYLSDYNLQNCRQNSNSNTTACRYVRRTSSSKHCDNLNQTQVFQNSDFTNIYSAVGAVNTNNATIISTNCAILQSPNYNPGLENSLLALGSVYSALFIILFFVFCVYQLIRKIPPLWEKR